MIITSQVRDSVLAFNAIWILAHFIYFVIYYSKYSGYFHKLSSVDHLEKSNLYDQKLIDITRSNTWNKIRKLKRISYFPTLGIGFLHLVVFNLYWEMEVFTEYWLSAVYILVGGLIFILLANKTQGARVLRGRKGPFIRGPF